MDPRSGLLLVLDDIARDLSGLVFRHREMTGLIHVPVHLEDENSPFFWGSVHERRKGMALGAPACEKCGG